MRLSMFRVIIVPASCACVMFFSLRKARMVLPICMKTLRENWIGKDILLQFSILPYPSRPVNFQDAFLAVFLDRFFHLRTHATILKPQIIHM